MHVSKLSNKELFNILDDYKKFCVKFGRAYNEADVLKTTSDNYKDFMLYSSGNKISNHWKRDDQLPENPNDLRKYYESIYDPFPGWETYWLNKNRRQQPRR